VAGGPKNQHIMRGSGGTMVLYQLKMQIKLTPNNAEWTDGGNARKTTQRIKERVQRTSAEKTRKKCEERKTMRGLVNKLIDDGS